MLNLTNKGKIKKICKETLSVIATIILIPMLLIKPLLVVLKYLFRSCYTQYKRVELKSSSLSLVISYPTLLVGGKYIKCGKNVFLGSNGILSAWSNYQGDNFTPEISIGDNVTIGNGYHISAISKITIGNNVLMGKYITIVDNSHGEVTRSEMSVPPIKRSLKKLGEVVIEDNVWISDKVTIAKGVRIGYGAIIGANSVVTSDIPPFCIAVGSPARIIKRY